MFISTCCHAAIVPNEAEEPSTCTPPKCTAHIGICGFRTIYVVRADGFTSIERAVSRPTTRSFPNFVPRCITTHIAFQGSARHCSCKEIFIPSCVFTNCSCNSVYVTLFRRFLLRRFRSARRFTLSENTVKSNVLVSLEFRNILDKLRAYTACVIKIY